MEKTRLLIVSYLLAVTGLLPTIAFAENTQPCGSESVKTGKSYKVSGEDIDVRHGPSIEFSKIVNQKASRILKSTHYISIDSSVTVIEQCTQGKWSKIRVTEPDYLSQSHRGWVPSNVLRGKKVDSSGTEIFTEADFIFDKKTRPHKSILIAGVNRIHRENSRCKNIEPSSAYISSSRGSKSDPVFFVTCGKGVKVFNVFFSKSDIENVTGINK
jgi:hypothetical protein